jgi:hypothetical protein
VPWRGPEVHGEFATLGYSVADYIEQNCVIPDGDHQGDPYLLTDEMLRFLLWYYRLDSESGKFVYHRGGQLVRPQKQGKSPFGAAIICAEAEGPVLFDGWDSSGEPVGRPWMTPWIQVTAVSEAQTANVWRALVPMIELGNLKADIPDTGETRINLPGGGRIEPVTSSARSRLGQRITFALEDETHAWTVHNRGRKLADNQRRNLAGMGGRWLETTNAWDPVEESVAQQTFESKISGVFIDDVDPGSGSIRNKRERRRMLKKVYGDSWWVDLDRIEAEILELLPRDPSQAERYFLNRKVAEEGSAFDMGRWVELGKRKTVADGTLITIGVDGARFDDAIAIVGTAVEVGYQYVLGVWERPKNARDDYAHPLDEVDGVMSEAFERFEVWRAYCDPQYIERLVDEWQGRWGDKRVLEWFTNRPRQMAYACRSYATAIAGKDLSHDANPVMAIHIGNSRRRSVNVYDEQRRQMWVIVKDAPMSPRKIDAASAGILSWEARGDAIAAGATEKQESVYEKRGLRTIGQSDGKPVSREEKREVITPVGS